MSDWFEGVPIQPNPRTDTGDFSFWVDGGPILSPVSAIPADTSLSGSSITVETGTVTVSVGVVIDLTGSEVVVEDGNESVYIGSEVPLTGSEITVETGTVDVSCGVTIDLVGSEVLLETGTATVSVGIMIDLTGEEITIEADEPVVFTGPLTLQVSWTLPEHNDLAYIKVWKSLTSGFDPEVLAPDQVLSASDYGFENLPTSTEVLIASTVDGHPTYYFRIGVFDVWGDEIVIGTGGNVTDEIVFPAAP